MPIERLQDSRHPSGTPIHVLQRGRRPSPGTLVDNQSGIRVECPHGPTLGQPILFRAVIGGQACEAFGSVVRVDPGGFAVQLDLVANTFHRVLAGTVAQPSGAVLLLP